MMIEKDAIEAQARAATENVDISARKKRKTDLETRTRREKRNIKSTEDLLQILDHEWNDKFDLEQFIKMDGGNN